MQNYSADISKKWEYENGFYLTCDTSRIGKLLNHLETYNKILGLPGAIHKPQFNHLPAFIIKN